MYYQSDEEEIEEKNEEMETDDINNFDIEAFLDSIQMSEDEPEYDAASRQLSLQYSRRESRHYQIEQPRDLQGKAGQIEGLIEDQRRRSGVLHRENTW